MSKLSWYESLQDPRWQRKRLEIFERNDFECENCGAKDKTLHTHHGYYEKGLMPWEYPDDTLYCLCSDCHEIATLMLGHINKLIGKLYGSLEQIYGYLNALDSLRMDISIVPLSSYDEATGISDAIRVDPETIIHHAQQGMVSINQLKKFIKKHG